MATDKEDIEKMSEKFRHKQFRRQAWGCERRDHPNTRRVGQQEGCEQRDRLEVGQNNTRKRQYEGRGADDATTWQGRPGCEQRDRQSK